MIFRVVYHRIEITVSHVTHIRMPGKLRLYEYQLVLNCGQFLHTFFTLTQQKKLLMLDENY